MHTEKLQPQDVKKNSFVVIEKHPFCFEIGLVKETEYTMKHNIIVILVLTRTHFTTIPPVLDKDFIPFILNPNQELSLDVHPLYILDRKIVMDLLAQQDQHMKERHLDNEPEYRTFKVLERFLSDLCPQT